jgi:hypothetical protein
MLNMTMFGMNCGKEEREAALESISDLTMPSVHILNKLLLKHYVKCKAVVRRVLKSAKYVCTTTDGWTSRSKGRGFLGTTVHWIDPKTMMRRSACLGATRLKGSHTHKVLARAMYKINKDFGIVKSLVATVTDNSSNFCTAFRVFGEVPEEKKGNEEEVQVVLVQEEAPPTTSQAKKKKVREDEDIDTDDEIEQLEQVEHEEGEAELSTEVDNPDEMYAENIPREFIDIEKALTEQPEESQDVTSKARQGRVEKADVDNYEGLSSDTDDESNDETGK